MPQYTPTHTQSLKHLLKTDLPTFNTLGVVGLSDTIHPTTDAGREVALSSELCLQLPVGIF